MEKRKIKIVFTFLPSLSLLINVCAKLASIWNTRKLKTNVSIETSDFSTEEKFSVSLNSVMGLPIWFILSVVFSYSNRNQRLLFFFPLQLMILSVIIPSIMISHNERMKRTFYLNFIEPGFTNSIVTFNRFKNRNSSRVSPLYGIITWNVLRHLNISSTSGKSNIRKSWKVFRLFLLSLQCFVLEFLTYFHLQWCFVTRFHIYLSKKSRSVPPTFCLWFIGFQKNYIFVLSFSKRC